MTWCFVTSKFILFCLNFLFVLIGLALVAIGAWIAADNQGFLDTIQFFSSKESVELQLYQGTSIILYFSYGVIVMGGLLVIITFIGCWAVVSENRGLLIAYTALLSLLVLLEGGAAAAMGGTVDMWTKDYENSTSNQFVKNYVGTFGAFNVSEYEPYSLTMDILMIELNCCGLNGASDFTNTQSRWYASGRRYLNVAYGDAVKIPPACCKYTSKAFLKKYDYNAFEDNLQDQNCVLTTNESNSNQGCLAASKKKVFEKGLPYIAIPIIIVALQLVCIGVSAYLITKIKKWDEELYY
uniref:Tetraspanin n=1 Tax=Trichobilharzia regenti TaxID=157069 RepID=A0AA85JN10_TRIRE|nr:unnamed protein product [Trichobilharzia regenti]